MPSYVFKWAPVGLLALTTMMLGCQGSSLAKGNTWLPYPDVDDRPRSIVFNAPTLHRLIEPIESTPGQTDWWPWYASRNDARATTLAGYQTNTIDRVVNITYDRQITTGGHARDRYYSNTYRSTTTQIVR